MTDRLKHVGKDVSHFEGGKVLDCKTCGFKHVLPLPDAEKLVSFYEQEFYQTEKALYIQESAEDVEWKNIEFERRFKLAEQELKNDSRRKVLDIGCGPGDFLALGKQLGWYGVGIEPSSVAANYATDRGLEVVTGFFNQNLIGELGSFDFIHMSEVLEHVPNPSELLNLAMGLLTSGGVLCVSVPNDYSPLQKVLLDTEQYSPWWVVPDHHLNYFDFESLAKLVSSTGYELLEKTTNFPMELFLLMGQDYTDDAELGRNLHSWRKTFDMTMGKFAPELLSDFYAAFAKAKMGRLAIQFARKPR